MNLLILNCGSSSLSYKLYRTTSPVDLLPAGHGKAVHVGVKSQEAPYLMHHIAGRTIRREPSLPDHASAAGEILNTLGEEGFSIDAVGHRFVHGGMEFTHSARITSANMARLESVSSLAPLHNPSSMAVLRLCQERLPQAAQFAAFDTAFHAQIPEDARLYALPFELAQRLGLRKYGFHGLSYQYVSAEAARFLQAAPERLALIACHLGTGGSSAAAIRDGHSIDTSMGYTPLAGLVMSTRSGDIDPAIPLALIEQEGFSAQQIDRLLNKQSGLLGVSGFSSDLFEIVARAEGGDARARLAFEMYTHRLKHYIGGYLAILEGCDALVFTDDIGQRCWQVRAAACAGLGRLGLELDEAANRAAAGGAIEVISTPASSIKILVIPTDEELIIAREGLALLQ